MSPPGSDPESRGKVGRAICFVEHENCKSVRACSVDLVVKMVGGGRGTDQGGEGGRGRRRMRERRDCVAIPLGPHPCKAQWHRKSCDNVTMCQPALCGYRCFPRAFSKHCGSMSNGSGCAVTGVSRGCSLTSAVRCQLVPLVWLPGFSEAVFLRARLDAPVARRAECSDEHRCYSKFEFRIRFRPRSRETPALELTECCSNLLPSEVGRTPVVFALWLAI